MTLEYILAGITILGFLFGIAKWICSTASKLVEAITKLNAGVNSLGDNFASFKEDAKQEHEETRERLNDHESRIHSLEDWKKYKDKEL